MSSPPLASSSSAVAVPEVDLTYTAAALKSQVDCKADLARRERRILSGDITVFEECGLVDSAVLAIDSNWNEPREKFADMDLPEDMVCAIENNTAMHAPSLLQKTAIPAILSRRNLLVQAVTGTGKSAAIVISLLAMIDRRRLTPQALVVTVTREAAQIVHLIAQSIGGSLGIRSLACVSPILRDDIEPLRCGVQLVVGTPGRLLDLLRRGALCVDAVGVVVVDQADDIPPRGLQSQVEQLCQSITPQPQVCVFCSTITQEVSTMVNSLIFSPSSPPPTSDVKENNNNNSSGGSSNVTSPKRKESSNAEYRDSISNSNSSSSSSSGSGSGSGGNIRRRNSNVFGTPRKMSVTGGGGGGGGSGCVSGAGSRRGSLAGLNNNNNVNNMNMGMGSMVMKQSHTYNSPAKVGKGQRLRERRGSGSSTSTFTSVCVDRGELIKITVSRAELFLDGVTQFFIRGSMQDGIKWKMQALQDLIQVSTSKAVVYCNSGSRACIVYDRLSANAACSPPTSIPILSPPSATSTSSCSSPLVRGESDGGGINNGGVSVYAGDILKLDESNTGLERELLMKAFKTGGRVLVTHDAPAQALDMQQVALVINFDIPATREDYLGRVGKVRGKHGVAISMVTDDEVQFISEVETFYNTTIEEMPQADDAE